MCLSTTIMFSYCRNMLIKNTKIKICDFGISKILESSNEEIMEENGTPFYMSAEKINGKCYGLKSDVWYNKNKTVGLNC